MAVRPSAPCWRRESVTRAADRLSVGQPAMSASLAKLRKVFGDALLVQQGRELVPTTLRPPSPTARTDCQSQ
ncbi:helix-turn-helix domain-containing protein [Nocardia sp. NPDC001965]